MAELYCYHTHPQVVDSKVVVDNEEIKKICKDYMERLLNEENVWDKQVDCSAKEGPECLVTREEVGRALKKMKTEDTET